MLERVRERDLQNAIVEFARLRGWLVHHARPARTQRGYRTPIQGDPGFPDLVLARAGELVFIELKSARGRLSHDQKRWFSTLERAGARIYLARPQNLDEILKILL